MELRLHPIGVKAFLFSLFSMSWDVAVGRCFLKDRRLVVLARARAH